ncbi:MAG: nucleotide exchange factor GrpE [Bacteroidales bacterium]|nr:nucleotide exchange factor GrpE [Bacteroidales bacterium]
MAKKEEQMEQEAVNAEAQNEKKESKKEVKAEKKLKEELAELKAKLEEAERKAAEAEQKAADGKADYLRLMAEFETFRRRNAEEKLNLVSSASAETIKGLLPVLDDCERALAILANSADEAAKEGTELIYSKMMAYLKTKGLTVIEAKGAKFDVDFHEAVTQFPAPSEDLKGMVIDVVQTGYLLNGKVLRYAKVVVGA